MATDLVDPQNNFFTAMEKMASNPEVDVNKIAEMVKMQEGILDRNAKQSFNAAMVRAQSKIKVIRKDKENPTTKSTYADLATIIKNVAPIYTEEGFSLSFYEGHTHKQDHIRIMCDIMHEQGHTVERYCDIAIDNKGIQGKTNKTLTHGEASAFQYGRRYLTCMIFNIPTGDDDGNAADATVEFITPKQQSQIMDFLDSKKVDKGKYFKFLKVDSIEQIQKKDFKEALRVAKEAKGEK